MAKPINKSKQWGISKKILNMGINEEIEISYVDEEGKDHIKKIKCIGE